MLQTTINLTPIRNTIIELFPDVEGVIVYGSTGDDYIEGISDIDLIIVGSENVTINDRLKKLHNRYSNLDAIYIPRNALERLSFKGRKVDEQYELHAFDLYRIHAQGGLLFGDKSIFMLFPDVSLSEALSGTLSHIRNIFITKLKKELEVSTDVNRFVAENFNLFLVIIRAIYTIETQQYGSKLTALEFEKNNHKRFAKLLEHIEQIYLKKTIADKQISLYETRLFLDFAEKLLTKYINDTIKNSMSTKHAMKTLQTDTRITIYETDDGKTRIDVRFEDENVWLSQHK